MKVVARSNRLPRHKLIAKKAKAARKDEGGQSDKSAESIDTCTTGDDDSF
jgi:hypothetical protein